MNLLEKSQQADSWVLFSVIVSGAREARELSIVMRSLCWKGYGLYIFMYSSSICILTVKCVIVNFLLKFSRHDMRTSFLSYTNNNGCSPRNNSGCFYIQL